MFRRMADKVLKPFRYTAEVLKPSNEPALSVYTWIFFGLPVIGNWYMDRRLARKIEWDMELDREQRWAKSRMEENVEERVLWLLYKWEVEKRRRSAGQQH